MARKRDYSQLLDYSSEDWFFKTDSDILSSPSEDYYATVSPSENIWRKFDLLTPPRSPELDDDYDVDSCFLTPPPTKFGLPEEDWLTAIFSTEVKQSLKSKLIQDCMWSGSDEEQARTMRSRKVSLSELTMQTASTSCVDPTTFSANPRQQNQLEHSYSLTVPEPMKVPMLNTPASTDDSESEEDVIDVVTVDTRIQPSTVPNTVNKTKVITAHTQKVHHNLQAVAQRLNHDSLKSPKCLSDHDFALPVKKQKKYHSPSLLSSQNSSDSEDFEGKRSAHNVMERQRRNDLKNSLHMLRDSLPTLETQERAPKVVILSHAKDYANSLRKADTKLQLEHKALSQRHQMLMARLEELQSKTSSLIL